MSGEASVEAMSEISATTESQQQRGGAGGEAAPAPAAAVAAAAAAAAGGGGGGMVPEVAVGASAGEDKKAAATQSDKDENKSADSRYFFDPKKLQELRKSAPWMAEPKYFEKVAVSPSAIIKIMMHCQSGVQKGLQKGGNPIEVMGMLLGRPDPDTPRTLVVTDAFPLPIEGFETRVVADDQDVVNHMIALGECLEATRNEKFMGWYHSHPFDVGDHSHCFLSQTDLSTQLQWQRAEDPHGNPFVAIVVDPLRSLHVSSTPELKAFRAYPPEYNSPIDHECPNGTVEYSEQRRLELWGSCWSRYYELSVEYYMSTHARKVLQQLTEDYLWMRTLTQRDNEWNKNLPDRIRKATPMASGSGGGGGGGGASSSGVMGRAGGSSTSPALAGTSMSAKSSGAQSTSEGLTKTVLKVTTLAMEEQQANALEDVKRRVFFAG